MGTMEYASVDRSKEEAERYYDSIADWYDRLMSPFESKAINKCIEMASVSLNDDVLEIGCGTGNTLVKLAEKAESGRVEGIDISKQMVEKAREKIEKNDLSNAKTRKADATDLPYEDKSFDIGVMTFTLELFPENQICSVLNQVSKVLKPGGRLVVLSLYRKGVISMIYEKLHNLFPKRLDCRPLPLESLLEKQGWTVGRSNRGSIWGVPYIVVEAREKKTPPQGNKLKFFT